MLSNTKEISVYNATSHPDILNLNKTFQRKKGKLVCNFQYPKQSNSKPTFVMSLACFSGYSTAAFTHIYTPLVHTE